MSDRSFKMADIYIVWLHIFMYEKCKLPSCKKYFEIDDGTKYL